MDYSGVTFGLEALISLIFGAGGALAVWFKLKGTVNIQDIEITNLQTELIDIKSDKKESSKQLHKRVDDLKIIVEKNRENSANGINAMTSNMNAMELRIIKAIHEIK
tara:strand:+ start:5068 stop:5388 length:321 start_codon:yes stop_codon:yes gene_type:complete